MRFVTDKCVECGWPKDSGIRKDSFSDPNYNLSYTEFWFCSYKCFDKTLSEFMPPYRSSFTDSDYFIQALQADLSPSKMKEIQDAYDDKFGITAKRREQAIQNLNERLLAERNHQENVRDQKILDEVRRERADQAVEKAAFLELTKPRPIPDEPYRFEHTHILGPSGSGKTTLIQQIVLDDLAKPNPPAMVIIDPKGLLVERITKLDVFNPETGRLKDRLVILDPKDRPALSMFQEPTGFNEEQKDAILNNLIETFGYIFSSSNAALTQRQAIPFGYVVRLVFSMGGDINTLMDVLEDDKKNSKFADVIARLSNQDPGARRFFDKDFYSTEFNATRQQVKTRLYEIISRPELMRMFAAPECKISFFQCLQQRKIVIVNTSMALLGSKGSQLVGRWVIAQTLNAIFSRFFIPKEQWTPGYLFVDEFQDYADEDKTAEILRLAREYNVGVLMAHQVMHSKEFSEQLRTTVSTNTSIKYCASPEGVDINYMARDLRCEADFLRQQTKTSTHAQFACYVRGMNLQHPFSLQVPFGNIQREPQMPQAAYERLLQDNRKALSPASAPKRSSPPAMQPEPPRAAPVRIAGTDPETGKDW